jgi:3D (Asp-Asp-Asp) domain-containing protein
MTRRSRSRIVRALAAAAIAVAFACAKHPEHAPARPAPAPRARIDTAVVTASAYNSTPGQTQGDPFDTASGRRLAPGMKALAVSPDLFADGLDFGTKVQIDGVDGEWTVLDRMPSDRRRAIDLYFGQDEAAARRFGKKQVRIHWSP